MNRSGTEFERNFGTAPVSNSVGAPRVTEAVLDLHRDSRPEQGSRSPPGHHPQDPSPGTNRSLRRPDGHRHQIERNQPAQSGRGATLATRRASNGPGQPPEATVLGGGNHAPAIVRSDCRDARRRCPRSGAGVDQGRLASAPAESPVWLTPLPARRSELRPGATARSPGTSFSVPALGRPSDVALESCARRCRQVPPTSETPPSEVRHRACPCGSYAGVCPRPRMSIAASPNRGATTQAGGVCGASPATRITSAERTARHGCQYWWWH